MFNECFMVISSNFKVIARVFHESFKGVERKVSKVFQESLKVVSRECQGFATKF